MFIKLVSEDRQRKSTVLQIIRKSVPERLEKRKIRKRMIRLCSRESLFKL